MRTGIAIAMIVAAAAGQAAAEAFTSDGEASGTAKTEVFEFTEDHRIVNSRVDYAKFEMTDPTHPMNKLSGPCFGVTEMRGGAVEGNGVCVLNGLEGDQVLLGWTARRIDPRGRVHGYWTVNAGKGLWLQASGGGTFTSEINPANGTATNTIRGAVTLR